MSTGQDHSIEALLLWRHYSWDSLSAVGGLQKDFQVIPPFLILHLPVLSNWRCTPLSSFAMSQLSGNFQTNPLQFPSTFSKPQS